MSDVAIKVEGLGKQYRLGEIGTGTISHDLNRWWARMRGKEDPFAKVGEANDRTSKGSSDYVWSLRDIDFEVKQGEVLGIIGRNGAGKSTLLKILSKVTAPTTGSIKINGRIASLLEVGTGFHPELTGRENIFLNGAILGMTKMEIRSKFDEIVDFSGVERYIDTPVKRYSSGMYVRLAFAVAAFLEPEILIVDEVLAVGDAEFQKKCLGRMKDVSVNDGRTVLFVSHHLPSIKSLCTKGLLLANGGAVAQGNINQVLESYQSFKALKDEDGIRSDIPPSKDAFFTSWKIIKGNSNVNYAYSKDSAMFVLDVTASKDLEQVEIGFIIRDNLGDIIVGINSRDNDGGYFSVSEGKSIFEFLIPLPIKPGNYEVDLAIASEGEIIDHWVSDTFLNILSKYDTVLDDKWSGIVNVDFNFKKYDYQN